MTSQWTRPTAEEAARGVVAILLVPESLRVYDKDKYNGKRMNYLRRYTYTNERLANMVKYGTGTPPEWAVTKTQTKLISIEELRQEAA